MAKTSQKNSFVSIAEQVQLLNKNAVEILAGINDVVSGTGDSIDVSYTDENGNVTDYSLPTIGKLQSDINEINNNIRRLVGQEETATYVIDGESTKRTFLVDLNREPNKINKLDSVTDFNSRINWFFEELMNPMLSINFDLTEKVQESVDGAISRRYIVKFERDDNGDLTDDGISSKADFEERFVGNDSIDLNTFTDWYTNPTNVGVYDNTNPIYDEQIFDFEYQEIDKVGVFTVIKQELDGINNKLWYHVYPFNYTTGTGSKQTLKLNDELILNKDASNTRWRIAETSNSDSNFRIRVERIEGYEPIPTGSDVLKIYGYSGVKKEVRVSIGFDEHNVIFMKPINSKNRIKSSTWSSGTGFYTNDLVLDTNNNLSMSQYYLNNVTDYGSVLSDLVEKRIPSKYGVIPNSPSIIEDNFKVVQINKHLTNTDDSNELKKLHSQKVNIKTKLTQVKNAIIQKNKELATKRFTSIADKNKAQNELTRLVNEQETYTKNLYSITQEIKSKKDSTNVIEPKFKVRGFWDIPEAKKQQGYKDQEVIQFVTQYRYSSKSGTENQTEGFTLDDNKTGYFSNWVQLLSETRVRTYDEVSGEWVWSTEDISDADAPNINQLDITLKPDEKVEFRVKSISEVGYPDSMLESDWSETVTIEFPDELNGILDTNEYILIDAEQDSILIEFEQTLETKGINEHVGNSFHNGDEYVAHIDEKIQTGYKDESGEFLNLKEYLDYLTNKVTLLENIIYSAKGEMKITLYNGTDEVEVKNNAELNIDVILQNYGSTKDGINFVNMSSIIKEYYIKIKNVSTQATLGFLINDSYTTDNNIVRRNDSTKLASLVNTDNNFLIQEDSQFIYFCDNYQNEDLYVGDVKNVMEESSSVLLEAVTNTTHIVGLSDTYNNPGSDNEEGELYNVFGKEYEWYGDTEADSKMGTVIAPQINSIADLKVYGSNRKDINANEEIIIPINIYWVFKSYGFQDNININSIGYEEHNKKIKARIHPTSIDRAFNFVLSFSIKNKRL